MNFKYESINGKENSVEELLFAIGRCQQDFPSLLMDARVSITKTHKAKYASLEQIFKLVKPQFKEYGVMFMQLLHSVEKDSAVTLLVSGHGAVVSTTFCFTRDRNPQDAGKQISYYKRYQFLAAMGMVGDPDADEDSVEENKKKYENKAIEERAEAIAPSKTVQVEQAPIAAAVAPGSIDDAAHDKAVQDEGNGKLYAVKRDNHIPTIKAELSRIKKILGWDFAKFNEYATAHGLFPDGVKTMSKNTYDGFADCVDHMMNNIPELK